MKCNDIFNVILWCGCTFVMKWDFFKWFSWLVHTSLVHQGLFTNFTHLVLQSWTSRYRKDLSLPPFHQDFKSGFISADTQYHKIWTINFFFGRYSFWFEAQTHSIFIGFSVNKSSYLQSSWFKNVQEDVCVVWMRVWLLCLSQLKRRKTLTETRRSSPWRRMISRLESTGERTDLTLDLWPLRRPNLRRQTLGFCRHLRFLRDEDLIRCWFDPDSVGLDQVLVSIFAGRSASMNLNWAQHAFTASFSPCVRQMSPE